MHYQCNVQYLDWFEPTMQIIESCLIISAGKLVQKLVFTCWCSFISHPFTLYPVWGYRPWRLPRSTSREIHKRHWNQRSVAVGIMTFLSFSFSFWLSHQVIFIGVYVCVCLYLRALCSCILLALIPPRHGSKNTLMPLWWWWVCPTGCWVSITLQSEVSGCSQIAPEIFRWKIKQQQVGQRSRVGCWNVKFSLYLQKLWGKCL